LFKLALQARTYTRHNLRHQGRGVALVLTVGKWLGNLGALVFLFMAINLNIPIFESATVAALYNFLAIIPLQTVGGIGVGEAGLTLLLTSIGVTMTIAAGSSLMIRFVILVFPFIFWVTVMGVLRIKHGSKNDKC
ncbi:MAG: lysylphosphatidylglycerol synthase domain-containing protein, partial [Bdellovibrionales bacterium]